MGKFNSAENAQSVLLAVRALGEDNAKGALVGSVEGRPLFAGQVERYIELFRRKGGLMLAEDWDAWCRSTGSSYESVYNDTVEYLVNFMVMEFLVEREGCLVTDEEVQEQVDLACDELSMLDLLTELAMQGLPMYEYEKGLRSYMAQLRLKESVASSFEEFDAWYGRQLLTVDVVVGGVPLLAASASASSEPQAAGHEGGSER